LTGRLIILRLTRSWYGQEDTGLTDRLLGELPGILLWAMGGWKRLQERGHFVQPASSRALLNEMEDLSSPVGAFVRERCEVGHGHCVPVAGLYAAWRAWCESKGREPTSEHWFGRDLHAALPNIGVSYPRANGKRARVYEGLRLLDDDSAF